MKIQYSAADIYPVTKTVVVDENTTLNLGSEETPLDRLRDFIAANVPVSEDGTRNPITDPFLADIAVIVSQYAVALSSIETIAAGRFTSTDAEPQYAGGVVSEGNRIFTPKEGAVNALESIKRVAEYIGQ